MKPVSGAESNGKVNATCVVQLRGSMQAAGADDVLLAEVSCAGDNLVQMDIDPTLAPFAASFTGWLGTTASAAGCRFVCVQIRIATGNT